MPGHGVNGEVAQHEEEAEAGMGLRVHVVTEEAGGLSFPEEIGNRTNRLVRPAPRLIGAHQHGGVLGVTEEEIELAPNQPAQPFDGGEANQRETREFGRDRLRGVIKHRGVEPLLGAEVVVDELLVDAGACGDLLGPRATEPVAGELPEGGFEEAMRCGRGAMAQESQLSTVWLNTTLPRQFRHPLCASSRLNSTRSRPPAFAR